MLSDRQVRQNLISLPSLLAELRTEVEFFQGGRLKQFFDVWKSLTLDPEILDMITGLSLELDCPTEVLPHSYPSQPQLNETEVKVTDAEIVKLHKKGVIPKVTPDPKQFASTVFARPKKDGTHRMILNLCSLNRDITHRHFKMDTLQTSLKLVTQKLLHGIN